MSLVIRYDETQDYEDFISSTSLLWAGGQLNGDIIQKDGKLMWAYFEEKTVHSSLHIYSLVSK